MPDTIRISYQRLSAKSAGAFLSRCIFFRK